MTDPRLAPCPGYEGLYLVSNLGDVIRQGRARGAQPGAHLRQCVDGRGYATVRLRKAGGAKTEKVHRLVCAAFHGAPSVGRPFVNHKDGDKLNNTATNLEWVSASENALHAHKAGLTNPTRGEAHPKAQPVYRVAPDGSTAFFPTILAACAATPGARRDRVWEAATPGKKLKAHAGFRWRYA